VLAGPNLLWRSTLYAIQGRWQLFLTIPAEPGAGEGTGSQTEEEDTRYGFGATSALTWNPGSAEVTLGTEGRWDHADYENWLTVSRVRQAPQAQINARQASGAVFLQTSADIAPRVRISAGGRVDVLGTRSTPQGQATAQDTKAIVTPKFGVLYEMSRVASVFANVSRGFRQADRVIEDPTIPFITSWAYEAGAKLNLEKVTATASVFRADVSNEQSFDPIRLITTNGGRSRRQGVELEADARVTRVVRVRCAWTFTDAKYRDRLSPAGEDLSGTRVFNTAKFVGAAAVEVAPEGARWLAQVSTNVVGPYTPFDEPGIVLPTYALLHLSGSVQVGSAVLQLGGRNLLDKAYSEIRAGGFVAPGQPRSVFGGVRYAF
jgi:iron complex outermembrane receptor protein